MSSLQNGNFIRGSVSDRIIRAKSQFLLLKLQKPNCRLEYHKNPGSPGVDTSGRTSILPDCSTLRSQSAQLGNLFLTQPPFYHTWHKAIQRNLRLVFWQPPFYHTGVGSQCENFDSKEINFLSPLSIFVVRRPNRLLAITVQIENVVS